MPVTADYSDFSSVRGYGMREWLRDSKMHTATMVLGACPGMRVRRKSISIFLDVPTPDAAGQLLHGINRDGYSP
jgi:hypothetical protein